MLQQLMFPLQIFLSFLFFSRILNILLFINGTKRALPVIELTIFDLIFPHETIQLVEFNAYRQCLAC